MTDQMTHEEMWYRLKQNEDPIDISLDKWIRMRAWIEESYNESTNIYKIIDHCSFHGDTCALCEVNKFPNSPDVRCDECILYIAGYKCDHQYSTWMRFSTALTDWSNENWLQNVLQAADNMIATLEKCKGVR